MYYLRSRLTTIHYRLNAEVVSLLEKLSEEGYVGGYQMEENMIVVPVLKEKAFHQEEILGKL